MVSLSTSSWKILSVSQNFLPVVDPDTIGIECVVIHDRLALEMRDDSIGARDALGADIEIPVHLLQVDLQVCLDVLQVVDFLDALLAQVILVIDLQGDQDTDDDQQDLPDCVQGILPQLVIKQKLLADFAEKSDHLFALQRCGRFQVSAVDFGRTAWQASVSNRRGLFLQV